MIWPCDPACLPCLRMLGRRMQEPLKADNLRSGAPAGAYQAAYAAYGANLAEGLDGNAGERRGRGGSWRPAAPTATLYVRVRLPQLHVTRKNPLVLCLAAGPNRGPVKSILDCLQPIHGPS